MPKRRKILHLITKSDWGGAQRYAYDLATRLPPKQFDITVAAGGNGPLLERLRGAGVRVVSVPALARDVAIRAEAAALAALVRILAVERPDVIHLSSSKAGGIGAIAACLYKLFTFHFKLLTVFTVHGWPFRDPRPRWQRTIIFISSWLSTLFHDRVIVINAADYRAARWFIPDGKLLPIALGIEPPALLPRTEARRRLNEFLTAPMGEDVLLAGTIAELTKNKGLPCLVEAARRLRRLAPQILWHIVIIGEGEDRASLAAAIHHAGLSREISLTGFIPDAARLLSGIDLFVLPSRKEGLPYALMEAMASGLPVVASAVGGTPDIITSGANGLLVPANDSAALAEAMAALLLDPARRALLGRAAARAVAERFPLDAMLKSTMAAYGRVEDN